MSGSFSAGEQLRNQRALARAQRRHHGQATPLDDAEERYEAIVGRVWAVRRRPLMAVPLLSFLIDPFPLHAAGAGVAVVVVALWIGDLLGDFWSWMSGAFRPAIRFEVDTRVMIVFGVLALILGGAVPSPGIVTTGAVMIGWSLAWRPWAKWVTRRTDYQRLRRKAPQPSGPSYIME